MRRVIWFVVYVAVTFVFVFSASAQDDRGVIDVRKKVAEINKNMARYTKSKRNVFGISTEGAEATYFHKGKELKKIAVKIYGETFNSTAQLYFENGDPVFCYSRLNRYDTQIGLQRPVKVVRIEEERYYFANARLIKVMVGKKVIKESDDKYAELRDSIIKLAEDLRKAYDEPAVSTAGAAFK